MRVFHKLEVSLNFDGRTQLMLAVTNTSVIQIFYQELQLFVTYQNRYTQVQKTPFVNIFLIHSHYEPGYQRYLA